MLPATTNQAGPESYQQVGSLVVKADGAVAWIGISRSIIRRTQVVEVHRADRRGQRELDAGSAIVTDSLRLHRSKLTWRDGGSTHSGTLL